jgi:hypothetical protein
MRTAALALVAGFGAAACTDLSLSRRQVDTSVSVARYDTYRFATAPLGEDARIAPATRDIDDAVRAALTRVLAAKGYRAAGGDQEAGFAVDYSFREALGVNEKRLDSPSDYQRSWRDTGAPDGTGSMDHTVADAAFFSELSITVLIVPRDTGRLAWEGTARRSLPEDRPGGPALRSVVSGMLSRLLAELPERASR